MNDRGHRSNVGSGEVGQTRTASGMAPGKATLVEQIDQPIARSAASPAKPRPSASDALDQAAATSGQPLPADTRGRLESAAGADLGGVRVHDTSASAAAAEGLGAHAYAVGQDIHFAAGAYQPGT